MLAEVLVKEAGGEGVVKQAGEGDPPWTLLPAARLELRGGAAGRVERRVVVYGPGITSPAHIWLQPTGIILISTVLFGYLLRNRLK